MKQRTLTDILTEQWENILKSQGLSKTLSNNNPYLSGGTQHTHTTTYAKEQYFRLLGTHLHDHNFDTARDYIVMDMRAEGRSIKETVETLRYLKLKHPTRVRWTIRRYESLWGIRNWTVKQRWPDRNEE